MTAPFIVFALPRSRTTWMSHFLSYRDWHCGHDELRHMRQMEDVRAWLSQPCTGTIETGGAPFWRLALKMRPDARIVTIRRNPEVAAASAVRAGLGSDLPAMTKAFVALDRKLAQIEGRTGARSFRYEDLVTEDACARLFEHVLPYRHNSLRWRNLAIQTIQTPVLPLRRYVKAHRAQLDRLQAIARQASLAALRSCRVVDLAGVSIACEPLEALLRDGQEAMRDHCAEIGEHPAGWEAKNLPAFQAAEDAGRLQVVVARSNGRVFGYLVTTIGESLEAPGRLWACNTAFYAGLPSLGLRLQRKAVEALRARGVHEVAMRAGVRGAGDRVSTLYRRLGAEPFGTYYRLQIKDAA